MTSESAASGGEWTAPASEPTRQLLAMLVTIDRPCEWELVVAVAGGDDDAALVMLDEALKHELVTSIGGSYEATATGSAAVAETNPARIATRHRAAAELLLSLHGDAPDHAVEIAEHHHRSAALPGREAGIPHCRRAANAARERGDLTGAARLWRMAVDLAAASPPQVRAELDGRLAIALAESLEHAEALVRTRDALHAHALAGTPDAEVVGFLADAARAIKEAGAPTRDWLPLVERGLALAGERHDLAWARLTLLQDPIEVVAHGELFAARWTMQDREARALVIAHGDERDVPLHVVPYEWTTRAQTDDLARVAQTWATPAATLCGLNAVARMLVFRHGDIPEANRRFEQTAAFAHHHGLTAAEADATAFNGMCLSLLGRLDEADACLDVARTLVDRLGPNHRVRFVTEVLAASIVALLRGRGPFGSWAEAAHALVASPDAAFNVTAPSLASFAVWSSAFAGDPVRSRLVLRDLVPILQELPSTDYTVNNAASIVVRGMWELEDPTYAADVDALLARLQDDGIEDSAIGPIFVARALTASLLGDHERAVQVSTAARAALDRSPLAPLATMAAFDEARILRRADGRADRRQAALDDALAGFERLGQHGWLDAARSFRDGGPHVWVTAAAPRPQPAPDGLSRREVEVLRLLALGRTNKQIGGELYVSPATAQRHVANIYLKIGVSNRAEATTYAHRHDLV